ncbi:MAG: pitrilysin family protein [Tepidisphaeraceae bacterium]
MSSTFLHHRLPNGLDIVAEPHPHAHSFAAGLFVKAGTRDEHVSVNGVSHFLEHMLFKGSATLNWEAMNRIFDEIGARYNAFTTQEMTAYYGGVLPEFTERLLGHLGQLLQPALRQEDFDTEKNVILEEIAMYNDEPGQRVYTKLMEAHFGPHPLGMDVLGSPESIKALTRDQMAGYFASRYGPANMMLSVTGRFDWDEIKAMAERFYGPWKGTKAPRVYPPDVATGAKLSLTDAKLNRKYVMGMTPGPAAQDDDRFTARVLADIVGDSEGSRFYWALVDNAIAEDADFGFYPHDGCGSFYISLTTDPDRSEKALDIALKELARVRSDITEDEVTRARNKLLSSLTLGGESPMGRMRAIGSQWVYTGEYRSLDDDVRTLESITVDSVRRLLDKYRFDPMTIVSLGPG